MIKRLRIWNLRRKYHGLILKITFEMFSADNEDFDKLDKLRDKLKALGAKP